LATSAPKPKLALKCQDFEADLAELCADGSRNRAILEADIEEAVQVFCSLPQPRGTAVVRYQSGNTNKAKKTFLALTTEGFWEVFKLRIADSGHQKGQRGGFRLILLLQRQYGIVSLLRVYSKEDADNVDPSEILPAITETNAWLAQKIADQQHKT
jgi:mRNA-degrading endonuclease RelE of RelBE toxin-antitoxin system